MPFLQSPVSYVLATLNTSGKYIPDVFGVILHVVLCHLLHKVTLAVVVIQCVAVF